MKRRIFSVCFFYCFFRLPIYESIAAIFWQSASYVTVVIKIEGYGITPDFSFCSHKAVFVAIGN